MDYQQNMPSINLPSSEDVSSLPRVGDEQPSQVTIASQPVPLTSSQSIAGSEQSSKSGAGSSMPAQSVLTPPIADDVDLIEKEWVKKIAEIILKTKDNPYDKANQLTILKQEYLQKRYSKVIKLA